MSVFLGFAQNLQGGFFVMKSKILGRGCVFTRFVYAVLTGLVLKAPAQ